MRIWPGPGLASGWSSTRRSFGAWMTTDFMA
jgi:hypothetical protein